MPITTGSNPKAFSGGRKPRKPKKVSVPKIKKSTGPKGGGKTKTGQETTLEKLLKKGLM